MLHAKGVAHDKSICFKKSKDIEIKCYERFRRKKIGRMKNRS